jgi:xylan 1,4-beta-xylosidase
VERRAFVRSATVLTIASAFGAHPDLVHAQADESVTLTVDPRTIANQFPHIWEECIGSDRASVGMRAQWLMDLDRIHKEIGAKQVRFHGILSDEMGVWPSGARAPNFLYVDAVFDAMMERGVKPFLELSFMPGGLASGTQTVFFYRANVTPPKEMTRWTELIIALTQHLVDRYGLAEVRTWSFEIWNEANLPFFWSSTKEAYFELYRSAANAVKSVDPALRVGGPATARAAWITDLLDFCAKETVPIDFVATHIYPDDPQKIVFGEGTHYTFEEVIPNALAKLKKEIATSQFPHLPLYITEWSSQNPAFIAHTIKGSIGLADIMSYWTFDSVYEELGIAKTFMNSSFGLLGIRGVPRPSFHTFVLLHRLGDSEVSGSDGPMIATKRHDGSLAILVWNLVPQPPGQRSATGDPSIQALAQYADGGSSKPFTLQVVGVRKALKGQLTRVDQSSGSLSKAYAAIGSPAYPTPSQIEQLKRLASLAAPDKVQTDASGTLHFNIQPNGVVLIELA